ncbi:hypothetical protein [Nocardiopsis sp. NRRL B-16309]|uniref:hypothetical protein n=1 Tax=Nocardiopsis sp. NRRL B-16309 TaxID=1519494 RepID=UPI0006AE50F2|nr:hypothetical protein [Nocardiopsis sp. NRRL B-16309]KOX11839.1 hypothetical protein ADL05_23040 [Nocardiopsis sp. NRRL B-16309]
MQHWQVQRDGRPAHGLILAPYESGTTTLLARIARAATAAGMRTWHADPLALDPVMAQACDWASEHPGQVVDAALARSHPVPTLLLVDHAHHAVEDRLADWERLAERGPGRGIALVAATPTLTHSGLGSALLRDELAQSQYAVLGDLGVHGRADAARALPDCPDHPGGGVYVRPARTPAPARAAA